MARPPESVVHGSQAPNTAPNTAAPPALPQQLPALDKLLRLPAVAGLVGAHRHTPAPGTARAALGELRPRALAGPLREPFLDRNQGEWGAGLHPLRCGRLGSACAPEPSRSRRPLVWQPASDRG